MYEWSAGQKDILLITGHTHQPVFESLTHIERLYKQLMYAESEKNTSQITALQQAIQTLKFEYTKVAADYIHMRPTYFNSGCCCFSDGDITGIEIADGAIRLIKWHSKEGVPQRIILEEMSLEKLQQELQ